MNPPKKWYHGGTPHKATIAEWLAGTPEDKLATAGDWTGAYIGNDNIQKAIRADALKTMAGGLVTCADKAGNATDEIMIAPEVAFLCMIEMGFPHKP